MAAAVVGLDEKFQFSASEFLGAARQIEAGGND